MAENWNQLPSGEPRYATAANDDDRAAIDGFLARQPSCPYCAGQVWRTGPLVSVPTVRPDGVFSAFNRVALFITMVCAACGASASIYRRTTDSGQLDHVPAGPSAG